MTSKSMNHYHSLKRSPDEEVAFMRYLAARQINYGLYRMSFGVIVNGVRDYWRASKVERRLKLEKAQEPVREGVVIPFPRAHKSSKPGVS